MTDDKKIKKVYLDHAATTPVDEEVFEAMKPFFCHSYGNANSMHGFGRDAFFAVDNARRTVAQIIGAKPSEIYFCSGGTEAINWAVKGFGKQKGKHIVSSNIEHHAVLASLKQLEQDGVKTDFLPVYNEGIVRVSDAEKQITNQTSLLCCMLANNEIGTIQPIKQLSKIAKKHSVPFFCDAVQAAGKIDINVEELGVDCMAISSHKFYGPKGAAVLYVKNGVRLDKLVVGGYQERTMRGGTSNVPAIVGFAAALKKATADMAANNAKIKTLYDHFVGRVSSEIPHVILIGDKKNRLPSHANFVFEYIEKHLYMLDTVDFIKKTKAYQKDTGDYFSFVEIS
ncbi:MAG: cysteine desulfurase, partial [Firmicutes bacterium]|nr:cysteine desulfurase [Bacillota bacterium]